MNSGPLNVIMRPCNMIMGPLNVNTGPWNVNRGPWNMTIDRPMLLGTVECE